MTNKGLVYLVNAGNDPVQSAIANDGSFPASGVLALGTWLQNRIPDNLEVICRDGQVYGMDKIEEDLKSYRPGLVGISTLFSSYQNSLKIAEMARAYGAKVVLGNDQAAQTSIAIIENQRNIDYVIGAEYGEFPLELLVRKIRGEAIPLETIPSLTYRENDGSAAGFNFHRDRSKLSIIHPLSGYLAILNQAGISLKRKGALDIFPILNRNLFPESHWRVYLYNYLNRFAWLHKSPVTGVATMNKARGCNRQGDEQCKHCDMLLDISMSSPEMFWEEVRATYAQVGANSLYEVCDSFSSYPGFMKSIAETKPSNLGFDPNFFVYAQAIDLANHPERVEMMKRIGVFRANVGLESMSDKTLKHMKGSKDSVEQNYRALKLLKDAGIHVYASFVLGSEKETSRTLRETVDRVKGLIDEGLISDAEAQPILPLENNYQGRIMKRNGLWVVDEKHPDWPINVDDLSRTYVNSFSGVSHDDCLKATNDIREAARKKGINYGSGASRKANYEK